MFWFILFFPLVIYPWGYDPQYTMPKVVFLNLFVLCFWLFIIFEKKSQLPLLKRFLPSEVLVVFFFLLVVLSTIFSVNKLTSLYGAVYRYEGVLTLFSYCSLFFFSYRFFDFKKYNNLMFGMAFVSLIASTNGILQHFFLDFLPRNSSKLYDNRSYSFFDNANFFGSYLVLIILLTTSSYLTKKDRKLSLFYLIAISLNFVALLFSGTRSGWVGVFCGMFFITVTIIVKRKDFWLKWTILLITLGLLVFVINILDKGQYFHRMDSVLSDSYNVVTDQSTGHEGSSRLFIWRKSLPLIKSYFWLGSGPDTFGYVFPRKPEEMKKYLGDSNLFVDKAHNEYLQIAITLGIPALVTYLVLLFVILRQGFLALKIAKENDKIILVVLISTIIGYLIQAFFNISVVPVAPLFWSFLGLSYAKSSIVLKNAGKKRVNSEYSYPGVNLQGSQ